MEPQQKQKNPLPWHPLLAVVFVIALFFSASLLAGVILSVILSAMGWDADGVTDALSGGSVVVQFFYVLLVEALSVTFLMLFLQLQNVSITRLGFKRPRLKDFGFGMVAYPVYFIVFASLYGAAKGLFPEVDSGGNQDLGFNNVVGPMALALTFVSLVILPPLVEEILFRGMIFSSFRSRVGFWLSTLATSFLFAIAHLQIGENGMPLYIAILDTFILSIILCYLREKTGSLWAGITLHAIKNLVAFASLYAVLPNIHF